jgi:hypothetical protein
MNSRVLWNIAFTIIFFFLHGKLLFAWGPDAKDRTTHTYITEYAIDHSVLSATNGDYLRNVGFSESLSTALKWDVNSNGTINNDEEMTVTRWLSDVGAALEDGNFREVNHFHNPITNSGFMLWKSAPGWAQDSSAQATWNKPNDADQYPQIWDFPDTSSTLKDWSWQTTRSYFYSAMTATASKDREANFAKMFRGVGQQMHLLQDMSVPTHVRIDNHLIDRGVERWAVNNIQNLDQLKSLAPTPVKPSISPDDTINGLVPVARLSDTDTYSGAGPISMTDKTVGLAEWTNANFFSEDTINLSEDGSGTFAYPNRASTDLPSYLSQTLLPSTVVETDGIPDTSFWIKKTDDAEQINHFVKPGYFNTEVHNYVGGGQIYRRTFILDDQCYHDYAEKVLPRAVGYSAAMLDYFFRGTLEITQPDRCLYGIIDGSQQPQQFTQIKAKVRNTTPNEQMQSGTLQAVARYKKRTDYQTDLSTDPPSAASREADFSYSVSAPITLTTDDITALNSTSPKEFTFDFSASPIPAGVTDLYLNVVFKGTLGNEADTAIAIGMVDLGEPQHHVYWNATDRFYLDGVLRTADEIRNDLAFLSRVDHDGDGDADEMIDGYALDIDAYFCPVFDQPSTTNVTFRFVPAGGYGRVITITDAPPADSYYLSISWRSDLPVDFYVKNFYAPRVMNQDDASGVFKSTQVYSFRGITMHEGVSYSHSYPDSTGRETAPWPEPAITSPWPADAVYP